MSEIRVVDRDYEIIREIDRWRVCTGKIIAALTGFNGLRACDRRLSKEALYMLQKMSLTDQLKIVERMQASHPRVSRRIMKMEQLLAKE